MLKRTQNGKTYIRLMIQTFFFENMNSPKSYGPFFKSNDFFQNS